MVALGKWRKRGRYHILLNSEGNQIAFVNKQGTLKEYGALLKGGRHDMHIAPDLLSAQTWAEEAVIKWRYEVIKVGSPNSPWEFVRIAAFPTLEETQQFLEETDEEGYNGYDLYAVYDHLIGNWIEDVPKRNKIRTIDDPWEG